MNNKHLDNGSIIIMHNDAKDTATALDDIIIQLQNEGYEIVPVSELIYTGNYMVDATGRQFEK